MTAHFDDGVQIIDITDPYNPIPASAITNGDDYTKLNGAMYVTTVTIDSSTFALVSAILDDGIQIIDITDPYNPIPASTITDGNDDYTEQNSAKYVYRAIYVTTVTIDSSTYALMAPATYSLVALSTVHAVQIIKNWNKNTYLHTLATKTQNMPKLAIPWASIFPQAIPLHPILVKYWD